jgi:site-specific recombinase XerD
VTALFPPSACHERGAKRHGRERADRVTHRRHPSRSGREWSVIRHSIRQQSGVVALRSWLVQRGVSLFKVQELLGHSDTRMTQKYAKLDPRRVADEVAAVFDTLNSERVA